MDISSSLIAKTLGALAAASAVGGGTWWMLEGEDEVKSNKITRYDKALSEYLREGGKIQFAIVDSSGNKLTEFPKNFENTTPQTITVKIKVSESDGTVDTEGKLVENAKSGAGNKSKRDYLRGINKGNSDWTWSCEITFVKKNSADSPKELNESQKDMIFKSPKDGLFGKLMDESADKKIKKEFVRECGRARSREKNKEINEKDTNDEIKTEGEKIKFTLVKGEDGGTNAGKLIFEKKEKFEEWFSFKENKSNLAAG